MLQSSGGSNCPQTQGPLSDKTEIFDASVMEPFVTWGTNPGMVAPISGRIPDPASFDDPLQQESAARALQYMDLQAGTPIQDIKIDRIFVGACTNARLEDLRAAADVVRGRKVHPDVYAMVVPGSAKIKREAGRRRSGSHIHRGRTGLARRGLLDVLGDEPRYSVAGAALRRHFQP